MLESFWSHSGTVYDHLNHPYPFLCNSNSGSLAYGHTGTDMDKKFHGNIICITGKSGNYLNVEPVVPQRQSYGWNLKDLCLLSS